MTGVNGWHMKALYRPAYCPNLQKHTRGPADTPTAGFVTVSDWHEETGRVEVFACTVCETIFGLDRNRMFTAVPDECVS